MNPAASVVLLTTLIGAGQGLFLALFSIQVGTLAGLLAPSDDRALFVQGAAVALALTVAGLVASFFHLGRPERAWRSAAQWRTSWLSREVIVLPAFMAVAALWGLLQFVALDPVLVRSAGGTAVSLSLVIGALGALLALALYVCTGMIYACLRFLAEWHTPLTPINYTLMGCASGFTLMTALAAAVAPARVAPIALWALVLTALAAVGRIASLIRNARLRPRSTIQSAIGVKHPQVLQRSMGFMGGSFNTREFFHGRARSTLRQLKAWFLIAAFAAPLALLSAAWASGSFALAATAFAVQYLGLLAERWFFFAQANHPQNLYYQAVS